MPGDVRLTISRYGLDYYKGLLEVYISGEWGTVVTDGTWSLENAQVACRQLGFEIQGKCNLVLERLVSNRM